MPRLVDLFEPGRKGLLGLFDREGSFLLGARLQVSPVSPGGMGLFPTPTGAGRCTDATILLDTCLNVSH